MANATEIGGLERSVDLGSFYDADVYSSGIGDMPPLDVPGSRTIVISTDPGGDLSAISNGLLDGGKRVNIMRETEKVFVLFVGNKELVSGGIPAEEYLKQNSGRGNDG